MEAKKLEQTGKDMWQELMERIQCCYKNELGRKHAENYLRGLLGTAERKNGWQMAEYLGENTPYALQQFIYRGAWSADKLRDILQDYVVAQLGEKAGIVVLDETGFLKKGKKSAGVARQYSGTAGRIENSQIGVFLTYASSHGIAMLDRRLYLPHEWTDNRKRCKQAKIPDDIQFATKPEMGLEMLQYARKRHIPFQWVTADCVYGDYHNIRSWLEKNDYYYVLAVSGKDSVWQSFHQEKISQVKKGLPESGWQRISAGIGEKGERWYDWIQISVNQVTGKSLGERSLLFRRNINDHKDIQAYVCYATCDTPIEELVYIAGRRWTVEMCFEQAKGEVGLDQYEFRGYEEWYKHITLSCLAHAYLAAMKSRLNAVDFLKITHFHRNDSIPKSMAAFKESRGLSV